MRKLLFVINNMHLGGTRKSLLSLLNHLSVDANNNIDLLVFSHHGELLDEIPQKVNILEKDFVFNAIFSNKSELRNPISLFFKAFISLLRKVFGYDRVFCGLFGFKAKKYAQRYDAVIGFQEGSCNDYASFIDAKCRIAWIHNNYSNIKDVPFNRGIEGRYSFFSKIYFVAEASMIDFLSYHDNLREACDVIRNTLDFSSIQKRSLISQDSYHFHPDKVKIVSIGRASEEKGYDRVIEVCGRLLNSGVSFEWVVYGGGILLEKLKMKANECNLSDVLHFLGASNNPYASLKEADFLMLPSYHESQPLVLMEALSVGTPVLSTNFKSSHEILENKGYGIICDNDENGIYNAVLDLCLNKQKLNSMKMQTKYFKYNNETIVNKLISFIDEV